ncbi:uncharacterized protein WM277_014837 [Molossus nigricans]
MAAWSAPPLRSAFAKIAASGATAAGAEAAGGGEDATGTARPARLAPPSLRPPKLLLAAMTAPRAAGAACACASEGGGNRAAGWGRPSGQPRGSGEGGGAGLLEGPHVRRSPNWRAAQAAPGSAGAEGTRPTLPRCLLGLGEGHLGDRCEPERWQRWSRELLSGV